MKRRMPMIISHEDAQLFRAAVGNIRRLNPVMPPPQKPKPRPHAPMFEADEAAVIDELLYTTSDAYGLESGAPLSYLRQGYPPKLLRRLKQGRYSVQDELDLHQMNANTAQLSIALFLTDAKRQRWRCVSIIHGKGLHSGATGPVLKGLTERLLRRCDDVLAFASARPAKGGTGAVIVLLKTS